MLSGEQPGYAYSRIDNPTVVALGDAVAELHGAEAGIALATGMAAIHASFLSLLRAGDRLVIGQVGYGTTRTQAAAAFGRLGVDVSYVDTTDVDAVEASLAGARTRILHVETIANPTCVLADLPALAEVAHRHGALLTVDNTFASPAVCRPLEHGADLVMESGTKYLSGHSRRDGGGRGRVARPRRRGAVGPDRHRRHARAVRRVPRPARDRDGRGAGRAPVAHGPGAGRRSSSVATAWPRSPTRASRAIPSERSPSGSWTTAARCCRSTWPAAGPRGGRSSTP